MAGYRIIERAGRDQLGEGPIWVARRNRLFWVDILAPRLWSLSLADGTVESWDMLEKIGWIVERAGRCDVLVNNAVTRSALNGWNHDLEAFDRSLRVNASALFKITYLFGETMRARKSGSVINIGSMMGSVGVEMANYEGTDMTPNPSPIYHYEKGGMLNFTRWAASILGADNVRVNCVSPGGLFSNQPEPFVKAYSARTQLGRMANDTDLKGAIVFLASDASVYITGANITVDGGYTAK